MFSGKMGRDSAVLASGGSWFPSGGARTEKSMDWAEWELASCRGGRTKRHDVAERSARVGVSGLSIA
jgi:hypothetical protein